MNIKENLTCKYCHQIFKEPITLTCCGDCLCKEHINDLLSIDDTNTFSCPLCHEQNTNQNFRVSKIIQELLEKEVHKFQTNPKYERILKNLKMEIFNLEAILKDPERFIYEQISELKRQVDLDKENLKSDIDRLAGDLIGRLEEYEKQFRAEYKSNVYMEQYRCLVEASKNQLVEYEKCLNLFSSRAEDMAKQSAAVENVLNTLRPKTKVLKEKLLGNLSIKYSPVIINELFGKLEVKDIQNTKHIFGRIKKEFMMEYDILSLAVLSNDDLVCGGYDNVIEILDKNDGDVIKVLDDHTDWINDLIVVDGNCLISASDDKTIKIWDIDQKRVLRTLVGHTSSVLALKMVDDGVLASGSSDKTIKIWNISDGTVTRTLRGHSGEIWSLVLLNNGDLASASEDSTIKIWDVENGTIKMVLLDHCDPVKALILLSNGDLVSGSEDYTINIWNIVDGTVKRTLHGHTNYVSAFQELDNGDLVSGSKDGTIKVWDVETGTVKKDLTGAKASSFAVLSNGDLVCASNESILIWE